MPDNRIYRGDSMPLVVSWFLPDADNPFLELDATIVSATVRLLRLRDNAVIVDSEPASIDGNETTFIVPQTALQIDSAYVAFITAVFNDGTVMTRRIPFVVTPKR